MKKARLSHCTRTPALRRIAVTGEVLSLHALNSKSPGTIRLGASGSQPEGRSQAEGNGNTRKPSAAVLGQLFGALDQVTAASHPRTFKLLHSGRRKLARKLIVAACEVTVESVKRDADGSVRESADLLYHLVVLWFYLGIEPSDVWQGDAGARRRARYRRETAETCRPPYHSRQTQSLNRRRPATCQPSATSGKMSHRR
jgi:phosphoribosyl-ATP pyrophosphohydrolase